MKCDDAMTVSDDLGNATTVKIVCSSTATAAKGMKSGGDMTITGGTFEISTAGKGMWDESDTNNVSATACAAIKCDGDLKIYGGDFTLAATGSGGKGINVDGNLIVTNCNMTISTTGLGGEDPWRRKLLPTPIFLPGESHGQRSLVGYSPRGHRESDITEGLTVFLQ